ncbi:hypothetical protein A3J36_03365 [Candidatus Uhrbacteria bacterium RIFCSPLOWO2_02_FULL_54_37]|uniref:Nudix hydrolase domain-containing protein n=1 Tax=Candidatus Uhrbacteria bacterium RIFCSPLOWO2_02_FULL_54_37 TaxID=1802412 RepID=A0A1F7VIP6_9BACT|nr:MAG: hypothetical protein A3J36_03365 [Candidatus Uhrbacteria bacterium RIFCSPLOWO2_02_FULL_54_37]
MGKPPKGVGPYPDTWHIPGGGVELGKESLIEALRREVKEETNIEITDIIPIGFSEDREPNKHGEMTHYIFLNFKARYASGNSTAASDMSKLQWVPLHELKNLSLTRPSVPLFKRLGYLQR